MMMKQTILLSALFLMVMLSFGQTTRQQQKLYPRTAFEKYEQVPEVQWISILMKAGNCKDFVISINEIKVKGTTNNRGSYVYKLPTTFEQNKIVTVKIEVNPEGTYTGDYETIKLKMAIGELVNRTHVIEPTSKIKIKKYNNRDPDKPVTHF